MSEIEMMLERGELPDFEKYYETGELVPVGQRPITSQSITSETPNFTHLSDDEVASLLEVEGN